MTQSTESPTQSQGLYQHVSNEMTRLLTMVQESQNEKLQMVGSTLLVVESLTGSPLLSFLGENDEDVDKNISAIERVITLIRARKELTVEDVFGG